jgi:hypothetical protein
VLGVLGRSKHHGAWEDATREASKYDGTIRRMGSYETEDHHFDKFIRHNQTESISIMNGRVVVTRVEDSTQRFCEKVCERYKILSRIHLIVSSPVI